MVTVSEVVVGLKSEGAKQTKDDLESVNEQTEETTQELDEQTDQLTEFAQSWSGALTAVTVGLAAASAGLLSQVPVVGQAFDGLFAILEAVALKIDGVLRPALQPLTGLFFAIAEAIGSADGVAGGFIGTLGIIIPTVLAIGGAFLGLVAKLTSLTVVMDLLVAAGAAVVSALGGVASAISLPVVAVAAAVAAIAGFIVAMITDFRGWRTKSVKIAKDLWKRLKSIVSSGIDKITAFGSDMKEAGKDLIDELVAGIEQKISEVKDAAKDVAEKIDEYMPGSPADTGPLSNLDQAGPGLVNEFAGGITSNVGQLQSAGTQAAEAADGRGQGGGLPGQRGGATKVYLNGREVGRGTNGERFDESARRGQTF